MELTHDQSPLPTCDGRTLGSVIVLCPTNDDAGAAYGGAAGVYVTKLNKTSFTIAITNAQAGDATFDWMIV